MKEYTNYYRPYFWVLLKYKMVLQNMEIINKVFAQFYKWPNVKDRSLPVL